MASIGAFVAGALSHGGLFAGAGAAAVGGGSKAVFDYNRENFLYDRSMRRKKEIFEMKCRLAQASLWREDVRDIIGLVQRKMQAYILVAVLLLSFTGALWYEGKLPEGSPHWLMVANQMSITGAFTFLLLAVWLATYTAVSAQSYQTRILTQLVRLPVPSWEEVEATRTYGSDFEKMEAKQMFRVPFLGRQQGRVGDPAQSSREAAQQQPPPQQPVHHFQRQESGEAVLGVHGHRRREDLEAPAADPWGLERRGDHTYELNTGFNEDIAKLRHVKLVRQAAIYYQTYDAFARLSLSLGANQLILAVQYFLLGYLVLQTFCTFAAFLCVFGLTVASEMLAVLDFELTRGQRLLVRVLIDSASFVACVSVYAWAKENSAHAHMHNASDRCLGDCIVALAFLAHGVFFWLMTAFCDVSNVDGAMLPTTFRYVLFLDVFGWYSKQKALPAGQEEKEQDAAARPATPSPKGAAPLPQAGEGEEDSEETENTISAGSVTTPPQQLTAIAAEEESSEEDRRQPQAQLGFYAEDYVEEGDLSSSELSDGSEHGLSSGGELSGDGHRRHEGRNSTRIKRPGLRAIKYSGRRAMPTRPEDFAPAGAHDDMRSWPGAPVTSDVVFADSEPSRDFFNPASFMINREIQVPHVDKDDNVEKHIVTGHDNEVPGVAPWVIFQRASTSLCIVWICVACLTFLEGVGVFKTRLPWDWEGQEMWGSIENAFQGSGYGGAQTHWNTTRHLSAADWTGKLVTVSWPVPEFVPKSLACDSSGEHFLATDGIAVVSGKLHSSAQIGPSQSRMKKRRHFIRGGELAADENSREHSVHFEELSLGKCTNLHGHRTSDMALACHEDPEKHHGGPCQAVLLHQDGKSVGVCDLSHALSRTHEHPGVADMAKFFRLPHELEEAGDRITSLSVEPRCHGNATDVMMDSECVLSMTSRGHLMRADEETSAMDAEEVEVARSELNGPNATGDAMRALGANLIAILHSSTRSISIHNRSAGGLCIGTWPLPRPASGFCIGGGHLHVLGVGPQPGLWRLPLPSDFVNATAASQ